MNEEDYLDYEALKARYKALAVASSKLHFEVLPSDSEDVVDLQTKLKQAFLNSEQDIGVTVGGSRYQEGWSDYPENVNTDHFVYWFDETFEPQRIY